MDRKAATPWSGDCGPFCTRSLTTDLSMRRKVTISARQALTRTNTAARLDHRSMSFHPDAMRLAQPWSWRTHEEQTAYDSDWKPLRTKTKGPPACGPFEVRAN